MRIAVDYDKCEGHAMCQAAAPSIFEVDDDGYLTHHYEGKDVPADEESAAREAVANCPTGALSEEG